MQTGNVIPSVMGMGTLAVQPQPIPSQSIQPERYDFIKTDAKLSDEEGKYCRCLLRVENSTTERYSSQKYNPYAVCKSRIPASVYSCSPYYDWAVMGLPWLVAYADLHKINLNDRSSRESVLAQIGQWKTSRGESF
jgi:hypothetical protein